VFFDGCRDREGGEAGGGADVSADSAAGLAWRRRRRGRRGCFHAFCWGWWWWGWGGDCVSIGLVLVLVVGVAGFGVDWVGG